MQKKYEPNTVAKLSGFNMYTKDRKTYTIHIHNFTFYWKSNIYSTVILITFAICIV